MIQSILVYQTYSISLLVSLIVFKHHIIPISICFFVLYSYHNHIIPISWCWKPPWKITMILAWRWWVPINKEEIPPQTSPWFLVKSPWNPDRNPWTSAERHLPTSSCQSRRVTYMWDPKKFSSSTWPEDLPMIIYKTNSDGELENDQFISGWWLGHPSEKYEFVNWDDNRNPIFLGKFKIHGNQSPPTRYGFQVIYRWFTSQRWWFSMAPQQPRSPGAADPAHP